MPRPVRRRLLVLTVAILSTGLVAAGSFEQAF